ncbi:MAG: flagellar M-ring protein FliF C-terminal domain-containing protein, partial [Pseudomonadota bacterium]
LFAAHDGAGRIEQVREDQSLTSASTAGGVPGALSNQPPEATGIPPQQLQADSTTTSPQNSSRSSTRNFEVDRTIRHTRPQSGAIQKLSVAVLLDDAPLSEESTEPAVSAADLERYTALVKEAVGFSEERGDTVIVMSEAFLAVEAPAAIEPPPIWQKPIFQDSVKQGLGVILVLVIAFGVLRPMLKGVVTGGQVVSGDYIPAGAEFVAAGGGAGYNSAQLTGGAAGLPAPSYDEKVAAARNISGHDPARVAQVVKKWVTADD